MNAQKILLIEDSADYQALIKETLSDYEVHLSRSAEDAWLQLLKQTYDLILLDIQLPEKNGFSLLEEIQSSPTLQSIPVVCITGRGAITDKVTAFSLGADDYLQKPFELLELKARVDGKLAKARKSRETTQLLRIANLKMDLNSHQVSILGQDHHEKEITLTQTEFKILTHFSKNPGRAFTRDQILTAVWGGGVAVSDRVIDVHICALRRKIKGSTIRIQPITGLGYRLDVVSSQDFAPSTLESVL
jgi:DNA-binding response OmpR family regulator